MCYVTLHFIPFHCAVLHCFALHYIALLCIAYISHHALSERGDHSRGRKWKASRHFAQSSWLMTFHDCMNHAFAALPPGSAFALFSFCIFCLAADIRNGWFSFAMAGPSVRLAEGEQSLRKSKVSDKFAENSPKRSAKHYQAATGKTCPPLRVETLFNFLTLTNLFRDT